MVGLRGFICVTLVALSPLTPAAAALVTLNGTGFDLIYDDSLLGQFGVPTLSGNGRTVLFNPTGFLAQSTGTQGTVINADAVRFDIVPAAGSRVATISVAEAGDYKVVQRSAGLAPAVDVSGEIRLTNLFDGTSFVQSFLSLTAPLSHVCASSSCLPTTWSATGVVAAPLSWSDGAGDDSPANGAPALRLFLQDILIAESFGVGDAAFIQKKQATQTISIDISVDGDGGPAPVPLPAALPLLATALGVLAATCRRRSRPLPVGQ